MTPKRRQVLGAIGRRLRHWRGRGTLERRADALETILQAFVSRAVGDGPGAREAALDVAAIMIGRLEALDQVAIAPCAVIAAAADPDAATVLRAALDFEREMQDRVVTAPPPTHFSGLTGQAPRLPYRDD